MLPDSMTIALPRDRHCQARRSASPQLFVQQFENRLRFQNCRHRLRGKGSAPSTGCHRLRHGCGTALRQGRRIVAPLERIQLGQPAFILLGRIVRLRVKIADEVQPFERSRSSTVETDAIQRQPDAPPGTVEALLQLQRAGAIGGADDLRTPDLLFL